MCFCVCVTIQQVITGGRLFTTVARKALARTREQMAGQLEEGALIKNFEELWEEMREREELYEERCGTDANRGQQRATSLWFGRTHVDVVAVLAARWHAQRREKLR